MLKLNFNNDLLVSAFGIYMTEGQIYYEVLGYQGSAKTVEVNMETVDFITVDGLLFYTREDGLVYRPVIRSM